MSLHEEKKIAHRPATLTGADARIIMGADEAALARLGRRKRGEGEPESSEALVAELARASVAINRSWFERRSGRKLVEGASRLRHPKLRWMGAILDGRLDDGALFAARHLTHGALTVEQIQLAFQPSVQHDLWAAQARRAVLSVITGDGRWVEASIDADPLYQHLLLTAEKRFLRCLENGEPPSRFLLEPPPDPIAPLTVVDMSRSAFWAEAAGQFRSTARAHADHERARRRLSELMPAEAFRASAEGVVAPRAPFGGLSFMLIEGEAAHA